MCLHTHIISNDLYWDTCILYVCQLKMTLILVFLQVIFCVCLSRCSKHFIFNVSSHSCICCSSHQRGIFISHTHTQVWKSSYLTGARPAEEAVKPTPATTPGRHDETSAGNVSYHEPVFHVWRIRFKNNVFFVFFYYFYLHFEFLKIYTIVCPLHGL